MPPHTLLHRCEGLQTIVPLDPMHVSVSSRTSAKPGGGRTPSRTEPFVMTLLLLIVTLPVLDYFSPHVRVPSLPLQQVHSQAAFGVEYLHHHVYISATVAFLHTFFLYTVS